MLPSGVAVSAARMLVGTMLLVWLAPVVAQAETMHTSYTVDSSQCAACHSAHAASSALLIRGFSTDGTPVNVCLPCHDGTDPAAANVTSGSINSFSLSSGHSLAGSSAGSGQIEGCATCHETHGSTEDGRMLPAKSINGVAVTSAGPQLCLACHSPAASTSTPTRDATGYPVSGTWPGSATYTSSANAHRLLPETTVTVDAGAPQPREQGDCRYCHASHRGSNAYDSLLSTFTVPTSATLIADKADGSYADLCFKCHGGVKPEGFAAAPVDIRSFVTSGGASAGHSIVTSGGLLPVGAPLPCFECHNPHGSNRGNAALISDERGGSLETTTATGVRAFCFTCHTTADTTAGWDGAAYVAVSPADKVVGIPRDGGVLHLSARDGHAQVDSASCYSCHGGSYDVGGNNVHNPLGTTPIAGVAAGSQIGSDTLPPVTVADLTAALSGVVSLAATDTGSGSAPRFW
jgi:predicted CXXCH cytochrome family protein